MRRNKYYLLLREFSIKFRRFSTMKQNSAFTMDTIKFDYSCKQQEKLLKAYAKKFEGLKNDRG